MDRSRETWPALPTDRWLDTIETVHLWTQVIGKIRLVQSPWLNHSRSVTLYPSMEGLTTGLVAHGVDSFERPVVSGRERVMAAAAVRGSAGAACVQLENWCNAPPSEARRSSNGDNSQWRPPRVSA